MARHLITERDVLDCLKKGSKELLVDPGTIITPSAKDAAIQHGIHLRSSSDVPGHPAPTVVTVSVSQPTGGDPGKSPGTIAFGADHGGYRLKEILKTYVAEMGFSVADVGTHSEEACDYPDFAFAVASLVTSGQAVRGIMIDGVGVASSIVANKVPGIRAVPCYDEFVARSSREHNDANVLTLGGRIVGSELAKSIVKVWLGTPYGGGRHQARVGKIADIEKRFSSAK
jgi:ribose 5-phosphate isomerase B